LQIDDIVAIDYTQPHAIGFKTDDLHKACLAIMNTSGQGAAGAPQGLAQAEEFEQVTRRV
jgi:hypothetical protein